MSRRALLGLVGGIAVVIVAVAVVLLVRGGDEEEPALEGLQTYSYDGGLHVSDPVDYAESPPVGGKHFPAWLKCGVYDAPIPNEAAVHDLEHGVIWITYDADALSAEEVEQLADALPEQGILSPYPDLLAPVVVTAWERQLALDGVDDPRLEQFVDYYEGGPQAPERSVGCQSGGSLADLEDLGVPAAPAA